MCFLRKINQLKILKILALMLFLTFTAGLYSEDYTWDIASNSWTPENPFSGDTWVINEDDTVTFDYPGNTVELTGAIENNGTLICNTSEIVFTKEYKQSSGELQLCGTTKFFADADLSNTTITFTDDTEDHLLYLYKTTTTSDSSYINIKTPSASPLEFTTIYMGGNVNLTLNKALVCENFYVVNGTTAGDYAATTNWAENIISSNSASYGLTVSNEFDINRFSATDGVLGYINLQTPFTFGGEALKIHSGAQLTVEENQTFTADKVWITSYTSDLLTSFIVKGTATINTELNLGAESNPCAGKLIVEENGELTVPHIFWTQDTYKITDDTSPFTNDGTINVTTGISVITKDSNGTELPLINNGTINASGGSSELSAAYFSGSGSINMAGGSLTASSTAYTSSIGSLTLTDSAEISALNINFQNFIFENAGEKSISFTSPTGSCNQTVSNKLILSGSSESSLLSLTGDTLWNLDISSITNKSTNQITEYLNITNATVSEETPAYLSTDGGNNSNWIFDIEYIWNGSTSTSWEEASNWTPSTAYYPNNERYSVLIPDGCSKYPETTSSYTIKALTIGTSTATSHDASITLGADNLILAESDGLTNYSDLIFTSTGRIADSLGNLLIDSSQGRVIYKSGSGSITAYDDGYYNLKIESGSWNNSESINVAGTFTNAATFTLNEEFTVAGAFTNQGTLTIESGAPLTVKGDLVNSGSISQSDAVYCKGACENVTDTGSWTFTSSAYIYFDADNSISFKSSSTSNQYNFDTSAASANTSFTGTSSGGQFLINAYTDGGQDLASFTNARFLNTATYTKPLTVNKVTFDASNSFTSLNATGDVTFSAANSFETLNLTGTTVFAASNSFENLSADGNFSITFPAGTAYSQSITSSLTLKGTSTISLLSLKSSSASSSAESDCFYINYTGSLSDCSLQYVNLINAYNKRENGTSHENITLTNSTDSGNNYYWDFPGSTYSWTGNEDTEWTNKNNWTPASVPGKGSLITIPSGRSYYPLLSTTSGDIDIYYSTTYKGSLTIAASASMDFDSYSFNCGTITNNGTIRVKGASGQSLTATSKVSGANSTFAYYSSSIAEDVWAKQYNYLTFIEDADGEISDDLTVAKTTTINTSGNITLSGANTFTGNVILTAGEDIVLNSASGFTIAANTGSSAQCTNLTVNSDVKLAGNLITESSMIFNQNLTLLANAKLQTSSSTGLITFVKNAGDATATNSAYTLTIDSNLYFGQNAKANPSLLQLSSDSAITISSQNNSQINFACKLSLAEGSTATLSSPAKVSGDFTNAGTFNAESRLDLYADAENTGSIVQTDEIYFNEGVSSVSDSGSWSIDDDSYIHFANTSAELTFTSSSSTNEYRFDTSSAGQPVNFEGSSSSSKMIIKAYRDSYSSSSASDGCTFKNVNVSQGQTFTKDLIAIDAVLFSGENSFAGLTLKGNVEFKASDSFTSLTADGLGGKTIIFPAGSSYSQTVTGSLTLRGTSTASLLTLKSSASSSDDEDDCFYINFTGDLDNASLQYLNLINAYNERMDGSSHVNLAPENSSDSGNNYYWDFLGAAYTWTGNSDTDREWSNKNNWSPASVPGKGSLVTIPSGKPKYPLLTSTINILYDEETYPGSLTIDASASMDFASYSFTAGTITNNGTIRVKGADGQSLTATSKVNGANSTFAYYSSSIVKDVWDYSYNYLTFIEDADGEISDALTVAKTTTINTSGSITLSGANTFTGGVSITSAYDIILNSASGFTLAENTSNSAQCNSLTINSAVTLAGNVITAESQSYKGDLTLAKNLTLKNTSGTGAISFFAKAGTSESGTGTYTLTLVGNLYCGEDAVINPQQLNLSSASAITASSENNSQINIATKLSITSDTTVTLSSPVKISGTANNNGSLTLNKAATINGATTNAGTINIAAVTHIKNNLTNTGSISQTANLYFDDSCTSVSDSGSWTIDDDYYIHFANTSAEITFTSSSSTNTNEYRFDTSSAGQPVNFEGSSSSSKMIIKAYRDSYSSSSAFDGCTFKNVNVSQGQTFTKNIIAKDSVLFSGVNTFKGLTIQGNNLEFAESNTFENLTAEDLGGYTITFPAGSSYSQSITESLTLKGTSEESGDLLTLKSSASSSDDEDDCFYINFTGDLDNASLQYLNLINAYNARMDGSSHVNLTLKNSSDSGNNYYWDFLGAAYTWTGNSDTEWNNKNNWNPASVPGKGSLVTIPSGRSKYPLLSTTSGDIDIYYSTTYKGSLTIDASASIDFASYSFNCGTITNNGTIRVKGASGQNLTAASKTSGTNSTFAYYSSSIAEDVWDDSYNYLTFIENADGTISTALIVNKTTTINTSGSLSLSGTNTFNGNVILTAGEDIVLNSASGFTIAANTESSAQCTNLTVNSDVEVPGNLITQSSMTFNQNLILLADAKLQTTDDSGLINFVKNAGDATATNSDYTLTIDSNLYFGQDAKANPLYLLLANTMDVSISAAETAVIAADLFIDTSKEVTFASSVNVENFYFYNGALTLNSDITLTCTKDFVTFGTNYNADDPNYSGIDTRFAYYPQTQSGAIAYTPLAGSSYSATFSSLSNATIKTEGNLYINGSDLDSSSNECTIIIPDNNSSNPVFNYTAAATSSMWGTPYAIVFNSTISYINIKEADNTNDSYLTASASLTDITNMGNTDGGNNSNIQFDYPRIVSAKTVYDDVIYLAFNMPLENSNGEINRNLEEAANKNQGGIWYNGQSLQLISKAYTDADCKNLLAENEDLTSPDSDNYYGFYIRTQNEKWNTDACGSTSTSELAIDKNTKDDSCDSGGVHHDITVDLYYFEGLFSAAQGHTMALNQHYDQTEDKCDPVMLQVSTGREAHTDYSGNGSQAFYDAHNFIELRYSEAVDIGSLDAADSDDDGNNNLQASESFGDITQNSTGGELIEGLTIAGLITTSDGTLEAYNKKDDSSPHALYRTFPVDSSSETKLQTHRIRIGIAAYVDEDNPVSFDSKEFNNWLGYIESASAPAGSASLVSENYVEIKDVNSNLLQRASTENHQIITSEMEISSYSDWDCIAPDFTLCWKRDEDQPADYFEILGTGSGSTIDRLEMHISDNQNTDDVFWATGYGWVYKESREWVDANSSYSADIIGGIRLSSIYDQYEKFKYGIGENSTPSLLFTGINPGASSSFFTGYRNENTHNIPTTMDNPYFTFNVPSSDLTFDTEFTISYDETDSYITDLAGNRLHSRLMSSIDRTPPKINICLASVGNNLLSIIFTKEIADSFTYTTNSGANNSGNLTDFLPNAIKIGSISGGIWTDGSDLEIDTSVAAIKDQNHSNSDFTTYTLQLNRNVTLEDIKTLSLRIESPNDTIDGITFEETAKDPLTGLSDSKVTILQDYIGNYIQMYSAHALSDFAINTINPLYAYDPDFVSDGESLSIFEGLYSDSEPQSHAVHDWSQNQTNFGTLPYGDDIVLIADTTDGDDNSNIPDFRMYLSARPVTNSTSNQYNTDLDENKRVWQPELDGYTYFNNLATLPNTVFDSLDKTSSPDFDTSDSAFENAVQYNIDVSELNNEWQNKDQVSFIFGLNNGSSPITIVHSPEYLPETNNYDCHTSPLFALRLTEASNLLSFDLWSFRLNKISLQRGGVTILNNVINLTNNEKTVLKVNMASQGKLKVIVMTLDGNIIKYLENTNSTSGEHTYTWDGTNLNGKKVARGLYFIRVIGDDFDETRKVMCVK
ncbi:MAG: hypothetical protein K6D95_00655 [Treponema sp.]|nr:hypothetical protein [Treponema sp.]